jgi:hypothetical protein
LRKMISSLSFRMVGRLTLLWIVQANGNKYNISN